MKESSKNTKTCHGCQAELPGSERKCPYCGERQQTRFELIFGKLVDAISPRHLPTTMFLLVAIVVYFIVISIDIMSHPSFGLLDALMRPPGDLVYRWGAHLRGEHEWWRLVTANFVHFGIIHIIFNAYALRMVSPYVERTFGSAQTFFAFIVLGTGSMLCSNILGDTGLVAGASGGLMAFIGMAAVGAHIENTQLSREIRNGMLKWAVATVIFGVIVSMSDGIGVDNIAHISGFVLGVVAGYILPKQSTTGFTHLWMIRTVRIIALVALVVTTCAFFKMGIARVSVRYQNECVNAIHLKQFRSAQSKCAKAYNANKTSMDSYYQYIMVSLINGQKDEAARVCADGRRQFAHQSSKEPLSFDGMCRSIGK